MRHRWDVLAATGLAVGVAVSAGCASTVVNPPGSSPSSPSSPGARTAFETATTKLTYIAQDGCQTGQPAEVYPNCSRYLTELTSAAATVRAGADGLPNAMAIRDTTDTLATAMNTFTTHYCDPTGSPSTLAEDPQVCAADLIEIRKQLRALIDETTASPSPSPSRPTR